MPITLTDEQVAQLRAQIEAGERARQIADSATQIWNDPKLSDRAKALWKEKFPESQLGEYDAEQRVYQRLDKEKAEREEAEKKAREAAEDARIAAQRREVQERHQWDDATMKRLEDLMVEKRVGDYEVAATYLASREPQVTDGNDYDRHFWQHDRTPQFKEVAEDPEGYARREIMKTLREQAARGVR